MGRQKDKTLFQVRRGKETKVKGKRKENKGINPFLIIRSGGDGGIPCLAYFLCWGGFNHHSTLSVLKCFVCCFFVFLKVLFGF